MPTKAQLEAQIIELQADLAILNSVAEDTFPFGTAVVFSAVGGSKWHYLKTGEETWVRLKTSNNTNTLPVVGHSLAEWVLEAINANVGYFEVYALLVEEVPFYPSA